MKKKILLTITLVFVFSIIGTVSAETSNKYIKESMVLEDFTDIILTGNIDIEIIPSQENKADVRYHNKIEFSLLQNGDKLKISSKRKFLSGAFHRDRTTFVKLYTPSFSLIESSGSGSITIEKFTGSYKLDELELEISGSGDIDIQTIEANVLQIDLAGSNNVDIDMGTIDSVDFSISGSGDVSVDSVTLNEATVSITGSGTVDIPEVNVLEINIAGSGEVRYRGTPKLTQSISGSGTIISKD